MSFATKEIGEVESLDYIAFDSKMRGVRNKFSSLSYDQLYCFNGKDQFFKTGDLTNYDYGIRIYNAGIGRFLSVDPLTAEFPWWSPYQFAGNTPIIAIDVEGAEPATKTRNNEALKLVIELQDDKSVSKGVFKNITKEEFVKYLKYRLSNKEKMNSPFNSCGPTSACYVSITHDPEQFVKTFISLWKTGRANNGEISSNKELEEAKYDNYSQIDVAMIGSLRSSENLFGGYSIPKSETDKNDWNRAVNATLPSEYGDLIERMGASVNIKEGGKASSFDLQDWTSSGKLLVLFGYYNGFNGKEFSENYWGGDHYITVNSIVENKDCSITLKYWHHGEYGKKEFTTTFKNKEEFEKTYSKAFYLENTGNKKK